MGGGTIMGENHTPKVAQIRGKRCVGEVSLELGR